MNTNLPRCVQTTLIVLAMFGPGGLHAQSLALTPADSSVPGQADPGGGWGLHIPTLSFVFQVNTSIEVTALSFYFVTTNGLDAGYSLTLSHWNGVSLDATLASTSVNGGSPFYNTSVNHNFAYATVTPVTLTPGNTYVMSATGADVGDFFYLTSNFGPAPEINFYETLAASNIPTGAIGGTSDYFGPNFAYTAVPEPSATAAWIGGIVLALATVARRRRLAVN